MNASQRRKKERVDELRPKLTKAVAECAHLQDALTQRTSQAQRLGDALEQTRQELAGARSELSVALADLDLVRVRFHDAVSANSRLGMELEDVQVQLTAALAREQAFQVALSQSQELNAIQLAQLTEVGKEAQRLRQRLERKARAAATAPLNRKAATLGGGRGDV